MPNKYPKKKGWELPKQSYRINNWPDYNKSLRQRGSIEFWLSEEAILNWVLSKLHKTINQRALGLDKGREQDI